MLHLTFNQLFDKVADKWISYQTPQITEVKRAEIRPLVKYNVLATGFNVSTVLIAVAVAAAIVFAYTMAVALGAIGVFMRLTLQKELDDYTLPIPVANNGPVVPVIQVANQMQNLILHLAGREQVVRDERIREGRIFQRLGLVLPPNWVEDEIFIGLPLWKNRVPYPDSAVRV